MNPEFAKIISEVLPWAAKFKAQMLKLPAYKARKKCPNPAHVDTKYVHARIAGRRNHFHMACEDPSCYYRMME